MLMQVALKLVILGVVMLVVQVAVELLVLVVLVVVLGSGNACVGEAGSSVGASC